MDKKFLEHIWIPDIFIPRLESFRPLSVLEDIEGVWIVGGRKVYLSQATEIKFLCPMRFEAYPMDTQVCQLIIQTMSLNMAVIEFSEVQFSLDTVSKSVRTDYAISVDKIPAKDRIAQYGRLGNFSVTGIEFKMERQLMNYISVYFVPSGLFVTASWATFLIPTKDFDERIHMLIILFVVLINMFNKTVSEPPRSIGLSALSLWLLACLGFVSWALAAHTWQLLTKKPMITYNMREEMSSSQHEDEDEQSSEPKDEGEEVLHEPKMKLSSESRMDYISLVTFPLAFLLFNFVYWSVYKMA